MAEQICDRCDRPKSQHHGMQQFCPFYSTFRARSASETASERNAGLTARLAAIQSWRLSVNLTPEQDAALAALAAPAPSRSSSATSPEPETDNA